MNPASTLPGTPPDFKIYHVNENGVGKAKNSAVTSLAITALPSNLVIKTFGPENHNANTATNYSTEWYANIDLTTITQLDFFIMLPRQYNHNLSGESISCSFTT